MPLFRTNLPRLDFPFRIQPSDTFVCIGSCFAENIGKYLKNACISTEINPFGILFNPISIAEGLRILLSEKTFSAADIFQHNGLWSSFMFHSRFSGMDRDTTLTNMNQSLGVARKALANSRFLIITLGSANVFCASENGAIVANNHKLAVHHFERKQLSITDITASLGEALQQLKNQYPNLEVIVSVSPVRHIKDGLIQNQRSKATLLLAAEALCDGLDFVHYFPAYELVLDDLRDYRFYEKDMIHPNEQAIDYVWDYFKQSFFSDATKALNDEIEKIMAAVHHRPFQVQSIDYQFFAKETLWKIQDIEQRFPHLDMSSATQKLNALILKP